MERARLTGHRPRSVFVGILLRIRLRIGVAHRVGLRVAHRLRRWIARRLRGLGEPERHVPKIAAHAAPPAVSILRSLAYGALPSPITDQLGTRPSHLKCSWRVGGFSDWGVGAAPVSSELDAGSKGGVRAL